MEPVPTTTTKTEKVPEPVPTTIHTTTTAEAPKRSSIGDKVWEDTNGDGKEDPDEKTGVPDVTVIVKDPEGNEVTRTVTDEDGNWKVDVEPGDYVVEYVPGGHTPSQPDQVERTVTIKPGEKRDDIDLGILPSGSVGDRVWVDEDGDGKQGENEKGLENVVVLVSREGEPTRSAVTDANGDWKIEGLNPNVEYDIRFVKPEGWEVTGKVPGSDESGLASKVTVKPGEYNDTYDLGLKKIDTCRECEPMEPGTIGDRVWIDKNGDGKEDPNEKTGVPNVTVIVKDPEGNEVTRTVTDEDGNWKVDVEPGDYVVEYVPGGHTPSQPDQVKRTVTIKPGEKRDDVDLGVLPSGSVGDRVWNDEDGDGKQGENEKGLENVVVLVSREGEPTRSAVTDENGDWKIEGLNPDAEYDIRFVKPEGWEVTGKVPGSDESGLVSKVTVKPNEYNDSYDLGLKKVDPDCDCEPIKPGTIGDRVWIDLNGNGKQDPNETEGVPDVTVIVRDADGNEVTRTVTDEEGNWKVNVEPGDYEIEYRPRDWKPTDPKRVTQKVTVEEGKEYLDLDLGVQKPKPGEPTPPIDEPTPQPEKGSSTETLDRCVANAVRSPLLYLVPVALLGAFGGEIARPYMGAINEQVNQINAQFQEAMRRNTPDWGQGGRGGRDNDQFAELRGQIDAANRRIAELGQDPNVQRFGTVAAGIIGLIAAGGVLYDWCSNEKGEAFTSIGGSSAKESGAEGRQSSSKDAA
nr:MULTISPECIES: SdrD B-like domain-containing protein [unclassified Corynebacterium]